MLLLLKLVLAEAVAHCNLVEMGLLVNFVLAKIEKMQHCGDEFLGVTDQNSRRTVTVKGDRAVSLRLCRS